MKKLSLTFFALLLVSGLAIFLATCNGGGDDSRDDDMDDDDDDDTDDANGDYINFKCVKPYDDLKITEDTRLCKGTYHIDDADNDGVIQIAADGATLNCNDAKLVGGGGQALVSTAANLIM